MQANTNIFKMDVNDMSTGVKKSSQKRMGTWTSVLELWNLYSCSLLLITKFAWCYMLNCMVITWEVHRRSAE
jgi:hypothetical protein